MKKLYSIIPIVMLVVSIMGCSTTRDKTTLGTTTEKHSSQNTSSNKNVSVINWGVDMKEAKFGKVYKLNPVVKPTGNTIAGFAVTDTLAKLTQEQNRVLHFALMSKSFYYDKPEPPVKTLFAPYLAIRFVGKHKPAEYLLISFGGEEWALSDGNTIIKKQGFKNKNVMVDLALSILPNDEYLVSIK